MPVIKKLSHVCLYMNDLKEAEKIFVDILGLPYCHEFINADVKYGFFVNAGDGTFIEVIKSEIYSVGQKFHICFETDDIYSLHKALKATHYEISPNVRRAKSDSVLQFFWFPANLAIEFHQFDDESLFKIKGLV